MSARTRHIEGFTLAELLLSIAIVLILAAIAIPSIISAQNNMRMLELDNAAEQIANAAQNQMTAQKVSGTWWSNIRDGDGDGAAGCKYPEAAAAPSAGAAALYYMTASQAKDAGIVPPLSIDESVRAGEYVIEFEADTASVARVFYADGKAGFFGAADPARAQGVYSYYGAGGGSTDTATRMGHDPMIGLYAGTPAGATPEKALKNPVISVDEETGCLWVQDPNLDETTGSGDTATALIITKQYAAEGEPAPTFRISGLASGAKTITISLVSEDDDEDRGLYKTKVAFVDPDFLKQVSKNTGEGTGNVFSIDLNALVRAVKNATASPGSDALAAVLEQFAAGDKCEVRATTRLASSSSKCVPAKATAYIEWPASVGKITLMITDPYSEDVQDEEVPGAAESYLDVSRYTAPTVEATTESPIYTAQAEPVSIDFDLKSTDANGKLVLQNKQAGWQSYVGGWVSYDRAAGDKTLELRVTSGAYEGANSHRYLVSELWAQRANGEYARAGYLRNNVWEWASGFAALDNCLTWYAVDNAEYESAAGKNFADLGIVSVGVEGGAESFETLSSLGLLDEGQSASIFVRTAPSMAEVQAYFNGKAASGVLNQEITASNGRYGKIGSRGSGAGLLTTARERFEQEFGVSSSDVSWVIMPEQGTGFSQGDAYVTDSDVRVYYSISPALGFPNIRNNSGNLTLRSTEMTNVALWLYRDSAGKLEAKPAAVLQSSTKTPYYCEGGPHAVADFELKTNNDYLFYRVLTYVVAEGQTAPDSQYVPHVLADNADIASIVSTNSYSDDEYVYRFRHWTTSDTADGAPLECVAGAKAGDYALSEKGTTLTAAYQQQRKGVGVMYLEFGADGQVGYCGYLTSDGGEEKNLLGNETDISSWGYYAVVPRGLLTGNEKIKVQGNSSIRLNSSSLNVQIGGMDYVAYPVTNGSAAKTQSVTLFTTGQGANEKHQYWLNTNFACAVRVSQGAADSMGTESSPWVVRHAKQFPGALSWYGNNSSIQSTYAGDSFSQQHDLDMADAPAESSMLSKTTFTGVYDGGADKGFSIGNVGSRLVGEVNHRQALFPITSNALLRNIAIEFDAAESIEVRWNPSVNASFGMIVGNAQGGAIENCSVAPNPENPDARLRLGVANLHSSPGSDAYGNGNSIGIIAGLVQNARVEDCSVRNVDLTIAGAGAWKSDKQRFGGAVGFVDLNGIADSSGFLTGLSIEGCTLTVVTPTESSSAQVSVGGMAGRVVSNALTVGGWSISSLKVVLPSGEDPPRALVGGFIGASAGSVAFDSCTIAGASLLVGDAGSSLDATLIGESS